MVLGVTRSFEWLYVFGGGMVQVRGPSSSFVGLMLKACFFLNVGGGSGDFGGLGLLRW